MTSRWDHGKTALSPPPTHKETNFADKHDSIVFPFLTPGVKEKRIKKRQTYAEKKAIVSYAIGPDESPILFICTDIFRWEFSLNFRQIPMFFSIYLRRAYGGIETMMKVDNLASTNCGVGTLLPLHISSPYSPSQCTSQYV